MTDDGKKREEVNLEPGGGAAAKPVPKNLDRVVNAGTVRAVPRSRRDPGLLSLDQSTLDPNRVYRWVRSRDDEYHSAVAKHKLNGYSLETVDGGVQTVVEADSRPDGAIAIGDLVLMSIPRHIHERNQQDKFRASEQRLNSTTAQTEEMAKEKGISLIKDPDHERITQESK